MGTNFYWLAPESASCPHCGRANESEQLHIGKSSAGWVFALHVIPDAGINSLADWLGRFRVPGSEIINEYGDKLTPEDMLARITERVSPRRNGYEEGDYFHDRNYSVPGINGLLRHRIDGRHCIGHGEGTWDYMTGEFS